MGSGPVTISAQLEIPDGEIVERFVRASGAGGQNVNKVSTRWNCVSTWPTRPRCPNRCAQRLLARRDRRMTGEGVLVIDAQRFRTQDRNREDARERLAAFIQAGLSVPKPRKATKPTLGSKLRRLDANAGARRSSAGAHHVTGSDCLNTRLRCCRPCRRRCGTVKPNAFLRWLARCTLRMGGWKVTGTLPGHPQLVFIIAPHSSNWDGLWGMAAKIAWA